MTDRDKLERRIEEEGIDPQKKGKLYDVVQYGAVLATVWQVPGTNGTTSFVLKFEHARNYTADGLPLGKTDIEAVAHGVNWAADKLNSILDYI